MAVWSKALPLAASCLSQLSRFDPHPGHVRKLPVTWGKAVVFARYSGFLRPLQLASHDSVAIWQKSDKTKIQNFQVYPETLLSNETKRPIFVQCTGQLSLWSSPLSLMEASGKHGSAYFLIEMKTNLFVEFMH